MAETWYFRDGAGAACGPGTRRDLQQSAGASLATEDVTSEHTWNRVESAREVQAGDWSVTLRVTTGSGGGAPNRVTAVVERRNSSCVVQETIVNVQSANLNAGTTETVTLTALAVGAVTFSEGDILTVRVVRSNGGRAETLRFNAANPDDSNLSHPDEAAGGQTLTPDPATAGFSVPSPGLNLGALTLSPSPVTAALGVPTPALQIGALTVSPDAVAAAWSVASPTLTVGAVTLAPAAVAAALSVSAPTLSIGPLTLSPDPSTAAWSVPAPSTGGAQAVSPDAVAGAWSVPAPSLALGELTLAPSSVAAAWAVASPSLAAGSVTLSPDPVQAAWSIPAPSASGPEGVVPLLAKLLPLRWRRRIRRS